MPPKTVAIIGAGPSGLASAKAVLDVELRPYVFEASESIGGLWSPSSTICRPTLRTNLSKHTCCFSDLAWSPETPAFPTAAQVGEYLKVYAEKHLTSAVLNLGCKVTHVKQTDGRWDVRWTRQQKKEQGDFDYLIIASGFFAEPYIPPIPGLEQFPGTMMHSSAHTSPEIFKDKHIAIIGGSLSSVEIADDIAPYAASIYHVIPRPFWVLPKYLPFDPDDPGTQFLPLDLLLYRSRPANQMMLQERWQKTNEFLSSMCGNQAEIAEDMRIDKNAPPYVAISDMYTNSLRSGKISLHVGHLTSISGPQLRISPETTKILPGDISHLIFATGFRPSSSPSFLSDDILSTLEFSRNDSFLPFLLHQATLHPSLPNAAFVGHYRGPYWGIIELQARWCAGLFSGSLPWPSPSEMQAGIDFERQMRQMKPRMQFPRADYVSFGRELAAAAQIDIPNPDKEDGGLLPPAVRVFGPHLFTSSHCHSDEQSGRQQVFDSLNDTLLRSMNSALYVAAAVFRSLHGRWDVSRVYRSRRPEYPSGPSIGTAEFIPRKSSPKSNDMISSIEYLYAEKTELTTSSGLKLAGTQHYLYQYNEPDDQIEVFFTKRDEAFTLDYLFHQIKFQPRTEAEREKKAPWRIKAVHPCGQDVYDVAYTFYFKGVDLEKWKIEYDVIGPRKDYTMETWYTRP